MTFSTNHPRNYRPHTPQSQGVLLLVDATQGVQAQTLANFYLALEAELDVIPIISKMDLPTANADAVAVQMVCVCASNRCKKWDLEI